MNSYSQVGWQSFGKRSTYNRMSLNSVLFLFCFYLMIVMTVINGNKYVAAIAFTWFPLYLLTGCSLIYPRKLFKYDHFAMFAILIGISALMSTLLSDVVSIENCRGILSYTICYAIITTVTLSKNDFKRLIWFYLFFSLLLCLILLFNYTFSIGISSAHRVSIQYAGIRKDSNYLSSFIVPSFGIFLYLGLNKSETIYFIYGGIIFIALFLAGSRASFVTMLVVALIIFIYYIFLNKQISSIKKFLFTFLLVIAVIIVYYYLSNSIIFARTTDFDNYDNNARLLIWNYALEAFYRNPLFGSGSMSGNYFSQMHVRWVTHSCYISLICAQGIIGALLVVNMWIGYSKVNKYNMIFNIIIMISFFFPLMFIDGYEGANFWVPMMMCRFISDKAREYDNLVNVLL